MRELLEKHACGWIDRHGNFLPCDFHGHLELARELVPENEYNSEKVLEERGYVKITKTHTGKTFILLVNVLKGISTKQHNTIYDWCEVNCKLSEYKDFISTFNRGRS